MTITMPVHLGHLTMHAPVPGFEPVATCCAELAGGGRCPWHTEDHDHARALAVQHASTAGHRVLFDDATSTVVVAVSYPPCKRLRASDGGVCGNDEQPVCTAGHRDEPLEFRLTFGQMYATQPHPQYPIAHPSGWVTVRAHDYNAARAAVLAEVGTAWADLYAPVAMSADEWSTYYPLGELAVITPASAGA